MLSAWSGPVFVSAEETERVVTGSCVCLHSRQACVFACDVSAGTSIIKWALLLPPPPVTWQVFWSVQCVRTTCALKVFPSEPAHDFSQMESLPFAFQPITASG